MIEKGRFYRAGLMKNIDPGHPNSTVLHFIKVQEGDAIPDGAIVEEGEFAIAVVCAGFDPKTKEPTGTKRYYVKATWQIDFCRVFDTFLEKIVQKDESST